MLKNVRMTWSTHNITEDARAIVWYQQTPNPRWQKRFRVRRSHSSKFFKSEEIFRCMKEAVRVHYIQVYAIVSCPDKNLDIVH